jgi:hypothetical protein
MTEDHPLDNVFKSPSSLYQYEIRPKGSRVLSAPEPGDPDARERALVNFPAHCQKSFEDCSRT